MSKEYKENAHLLKHEEIHEHGWVDKYYFHETPVSVICKNPHLIKSAPKHVFCFWTGNNKITSNRVRCLDTIKKNIGVPVSLITKDNLHEYLHKDYPLHPAYAYLSETCKGDYLKSYFMHFHGGGYTDIKHTENDWNIFFDNLNNSEKWINGYKTGAGSVHGQNDKRTLSVSRIGCEQQIGSTLHICKPETPITTEWFLKLHQILDKKIDLLQKKPSQNVRDEIGKKLPDGSISKYPIYWGELNAAILGDILWKYRDRIIQDMPFPNFSNYI